MANYVSGTDFLHSFEELFGDAEKVVTKFPTISKSDGVAAAERE